MSSFPYHLKNFAAAPASPLWLGGAATRNTGTTKFGVASLDLSFPSATGVGYSVPFETTGDFALEGWFKLKSLGGATTQGVVGMNNLALTVYSSAPVIRLQYGASYSDWSYGSLFSGYPWVYGAIAREGTTLRTWFGTSGAAAIAHSVTCSDTIGIANARNYIGFNNGYGGDYSASAYFDNWRLTKQSRGYNGNSITIPTAAHPQDSNGDSAWSDVLMLFDGTEIDAPSSKILTGIPGKLITHTINWPISKVTPSVLLNGERYYVGGRGRISGTVKNKGTPNYAVHRRVYLIAQPNMVTVAAQWSDPLTGAYSFDWVNPALRYMVIAEDYQHNFRAVLGDNLQPTLMP